MAIIVVNKTNEDLLARTGVAFSNNSLDTIKTTFTLELDTKLVLNTFLAVSVVKVGDIYTLTNGNWKDLIGAFVGANIDYALSGGTFSETIVSVNGASMELTAGLGTYADGNYSVGWFQITDDPTQFDFALNLVENNIGSGLPSLIDGESQRFSVVMANALTISGGTDTFAQLGNTSGGSQFTVKTISRLADSTISGNKQYQLIVTYKNWLCINQTPYDSINAIGDYYEFQAYMITGDPSSTISGTQFQKGNTGFQDEVFNGVTPNYVFTSIVWEDASANVMDAFDFSQPSTFTILITGGATADRFNFKMFFVPKDSTEYSVLPNPIENNLMLAINSSLINLSTATAITGNLNDDGAGVDISALTYIVSGSDIQITGVVTPNAAFTTLYEGRDLGDRNYRLWIQMEDSTKTYKTADRVNVLADSGNAKEDIQPLGKLTTVSTLEMSDHNGDVYALTPDPYLEDDCLVNVEYTLPKNLLTNPWLSIRMRMVAVRASDGERFTLEETIYDTSNLPANSTTGILPLDFTENRGYKLPATSDKHDITVQLFPSLDTGSVFGVQIQYPFIVKYQSWLPMPQAANDFISANSQNWYPYSSSATWSVQFEIAHEISAGEYIDDLPFTIHQYDDWSESSAITFKKTDDTAITKPFTDQITKVFATHTVDTEDWNGNEWGLIHVRPKYGAPQWLIGSVLTHSDTNNALYPPTGETKGKKTVTAKVVTIEALFNPDLIDTSGDLTFTSRVSGSTTGGLRENIYKEHFTPVKSPLNPEIRGGSTTGEELRGLSKCCKPFLVLADLTDSTRYKNDVNSVYDFGDTLTVKVLKDGVDTGYSITSQAFPNQSDARYATIEWRTIATNYGFGCYSITVQQTIAGASYGVYTWAEYELMPYYTGGIYLSEGTARVLSEFNDMNDFLGINMTGSFMLDSIRLRGKAGYNQPNTLIDNVEYQNGTMEKVAREDFESYELRTGLIMIEDVQALRLHVLSENNCWLSDHNFDSPDYFFFDKPVIVQEGYKPEYFDGSRAQKGTIIFEDKNHSKRSHFQDNRQTNQAIQAPIVNTPTIVYASSVELLKTGQTTSYRTGDDGDLENGRDVSFLTLPENNPFGNTFRFTDEFGTQTFASGVVIDWTTYNGTEVTGYNKNIVSVGIDTWYNAIDNSLILSLGTFASGWYLANRREGFNLVNDGAGTYVLNYSPFNLSSAMNIWLSTTRSDGAAAGVVLVNTWGQTNMTQNKANSQYYLSARTFTVTGTTLT